MLKRVHLLLLAALVVVGAPSVMLAQNSQGTLHDRASAAGGQLHWRYNANRSFVYPNIEELSKRSDLIIIGRTLVHRSSLRADGKFITQDFQVRVQEVVKGDLQNGSAVMISLPGGTYRFPDGVLVHVEPVGYTQAENNGLYVFFLKKKGTTYNGYTLASETQGLFAIKDGQMQPADLLATDPVVSKYRGITAAAFFTELHKVVPLQKK